MIHNDNIASYIRENGFSVFYHNAPVHWHKIFDFVPYYSEGSTKKQSSHLKSLFFKDKKQCAAVICAFSSTLFYWYNWQYSNCRDLSTKDLLRFPLSLGLVNSEFIDELLLLKNQLMRSLKQNSKIYKRLSKDILTEFDSFYPMYSKPIIDEIDKVLAKHYGFTGEELDFIINYDIKYRMGGELEAEE
jgi:predicted choloylglycine hydrolase